MGYVATLVLPEKNIHYLITKSKYYDRPSYDTLWKALHSLKEYCLDHNDKLLAMAQIGCGLDKLDWNIIFSIIKYIFKETDIHVTNYRYTNARAKVNLVEAESPFLPIWDCAQINDAQMGDGFCQSIKQDIEAEDNQHYYLNNDDILYKTQNSRNV